MSDELSNATRIAALEADVVRLTAELQSEREDLAEKCKAYGDALVEETKLTTRIAALADYNQRLLAENVRLTNDAAFMRSFINNEDVRSDFQTVTAMRQALDRERERCGVLAAEVLAWHAAEGLRKDEPHNEFMRLAEARARTRETHALDAAKFVGGG